MLIIGSILSVKEREEKNDCFFHIYLICGNPDLLQNVVVDRKDMTSNKIASLLHNAVDLKKAWFRLGSILSDA